MEDKAKKATNEQPKEEKQLTEEEAKKMCALEYNIKNKGETAYYYAHKSRFEDKDKDPNAITVKGPGIITGGDPVLLQSEKKTVEIIKEPKKITNYIFYDDDKFAVVKITIPDDAKDITEDCLESNFEKRAFHLKINVPNGQPYFFAVTKLYLKVVPEKSTTKIVKTKNGRVIKIEFAKEEIDEEWTNLTA